MTGVVNRGPRLRHDQATDHCITERLARLGPSAAAQHERQSTEQRARRRHQYRTAARQTRLVDCVLRLTMLFTLCVEREVHRHDAVLLDDADKKNGADVPITSRPKSNTSNINSA